MASTLTCFNCYSKVCEKTTEGTFDICQYGISFLKRNNRIETKEPKVPLSTIAKNLRHEINPILQSIIEQTTILDPTLSTKKIYLNNPLSIIIGSTVVLDNFIQMITGVHEFHSSPSNISQKPIRLKNLVAAYFNIYSIVKEEGRTKVLHFNNTIPENFLISRCSDFLKYIIAMLIDNAWKYSINNSTFVVNINKNTNNLYTIEFVNKSNILPTSIDIFDLGTKADESSKGFGYGLYWIKTLENSYNNIVTHTNETIFKIKHEQMIVADPKCAFQKFTIENIHIEI